MDTGIHLEAVRPRVAHRQWTLSLPMSVRFLVVKKPALLKRLEVRLVKAVWRWQRREARRHGVQGALTGGGVCFWQRRMLGLAQVALEGADPANTAPFMHGERTLTYGTGETVSTRAFYINTNGDPGVPTASGVMMARAAGLVNWKDVDSRYGKSVDQLLLDTGTVEGTESTMRWLNSQGQPTISPGSRRRGTASTCRASPPPAPRTAEHRGAGRRQERHPLSHDGAARDPRLSSAEA